MQDLALSEYLFVMGTSWVALIKNIETRASREMTSRQNIKTFDFNGVNVAKHWHVGGEVFAISDCLATSCFYCVLTQTKKMLKYYYMY